MAYWPLPVPRGLPVPRTLFHLPRPAPAIPAVADAPVLRHWGVNSLQEATNGPPVDYYGQTYGFHPTAPSPATADAAFASRIRPYMGEMEATGFPMFSSTPAPAPVTYPGFLPASTTPMAHPASEATAFLPASTTPMSTPMVVPANSAPPGFLPASTTPISTPISATTLPSPTPLSSMPADTAFGDSLGAAVGGGSSSLPGFMDSGLASGIAGAAGAEGLGARAAALGRGAKGSLLPFFIGSGVRSAGEAMDSPQGNVLEGFGLGAQAGSAFGAPGALVGAAGVGIGNTATALAPVQDYVINPLRHLMGKEDTHDTFTDLLKNGGALSGIPILGEGNKAGDQAATAQQLDPDVLHSKVDSLGLSPAARAQFVQDFNDYANLTRQAGAPNDKAMASAYAKFFGSTDAEGKVTPGAATDYLQQDRASQAQQAQAESESQAQARTDAHRAVALQSLMAALAPQYVHPMEQAGDEYNAMMPGIIAGLPSNLQALAQKQQADYRMSQANRVADQYAFYQALPANLSIYQDLQKNLTAESKLSAPVLDRQPLVDAQAQLALARAQQLQGGGGSGGGGLSSFLQQAQAQQTSGM